MPHWFSKGLKRLPIFLIIGFLLVLRFDEAWILNNSTLQVFRHLVLTDACSPNKSFLRWENGSIDFLVLNTSYMQAVIASADGTNQPMPTIDKWRRDADLYYWFMSQNAIKSGNYDRSLDYLGLANAVPMIEAFGHTTSSDGRSECSLINWVLAYEIGSRYSPDWYIHKMKNLQQWEDLARGFKQLLLYRPDRVDWRLHLGEAYIALGQIQDAEHVLNPILVIGDQEERTKANNLLSQIAEDD